MQNVNSIYSSIESTLQEVEVFGELLTEQDREFLIKHSLILPTKAGKIVCRQNETNNSLYLLLSGQVSITTKNDGEEIVLGTLQNGEMFGEISALYCMPRIATVTTTKSTLLLEIPSEIFSELLTNNTLLHTAVYNRFRDRTVTTTLRCVPFFNLFSDQSIKELCAVAKLTRAKQVDILTVEGEPGDGLYAITTGVARVYVSSRGSDINVALLREGEYFGERSLLTGEPNSASIIALTDISMVKLPSTEFIDHINNNDELKFLLNVNSNERKKFLDQIRSLPDSKQDIDKMLDQIQEYLAR